MTTSDEEREAEIRAGWKRNDDIDFLLRLLDAARASEARWREASLARKRHAHTADPEARQTYAEASRLTALAETGGKT